MDIMAQFVKLHGFRRLSPPFAIVLSRLDPWGWDKLVNLADDPPN